MQNSQKFIKRVYEPYSKTHISNKVPLTILKKRIKCAKCGNVKTNFSENTQECVQNSSANSNMDKWSWSDDSAVGMVLAL